MNTYAKWEMTRVFRITAKMLFFYPIMLACLLPYWLYRLCLYCMDQLDYLWWE